MRFATVTFTFILICVVAQAEDSMPDFAKPCIDNPCVEAKGNVWLRDSPPSGIFYTKGEKLDVVGESEILVIQNKEQVKTLFNDHEWLKVKRISYKKDGSKIEAKVSEGWVYNGNIEGKHYFEPAKISDIRKKEADK